MYLFDNRPELPFLDPVILVGMALALGAFALGLLIRFRLRRRPPRGPAYQVFRHDGATALLAWGGAQLAIGVGWAVRVEGLRMPVWSYLGLLAGLAIAAVLWRRERGSWPTLAKTDGVEQLPDGTVQRGISQTWEMGVLVAGGAGLLTYLGTVDHAYGHPIHWLTTGLLLLPAYALGLSIWSPRFKISAVRASRSNATSDEPRRGRPRVRGRRKRAA